VKHLQYFQIYGTWIWWHMHRTRRARFGQCHPILVPAILGASMFPGGLVPTMWFSTCFVHPARIGSRGRTRRQNEWYPCGRQVAILVSWDASAHQKPQFHPHKQLIALNTFQTKNFGSTKTMSMGVLFRSRMDAPKRSGEKKRVHDGLGFYSHRPSLVGGITVYEIAEELA